MSFFAVQTILKVVLGVSPCIVASEKISSLIAEVSPPPCLSSIVQLNGFKLFVSIVALLWKILVMFNFPRPAF